MFPFIPFLVIWTEKVYHKLLWAVEKYPHCTAFILTVIVSCIFVRYLLYKIRREQLAWRAEDFNSPPYAHLSDSGKRHARRNSWHFGFFQKFP